ncbi:MAG: TonB-dependent receptor [Gemmatimonadota bacterium]
MTHRLALEPRPRSSVWSGLFRGPGPSGRPLCARGWGRALAAALLLSCLSGPALSATLSGRILDRDSATLVPGALVEAAHPASGRVQRTVSDSAGAYRLELEPTGSWRITAAGLGYEVLSQDVAVDSAEVRLDLALRVRPLQMDEMLVRARRPGSTTPVPAFVEVISLGEVGSLQAGPDLPQILEGAAGVNVRRQGGLGSFSTISIRGSTAEQVQIYLDGVPLNQATGGGVDLGDLPVGGIESVEVYRGAVPARFGGNSLGGVVHLRTRGASGERSARLQASAGAFGTRRLGASGSGTWQEWQLLGLVDYEAADNDFRFWDDNGTEYNRGDDEWSRRVNADFLSLRGLAKAGRRWGPGQVAIHSALDLSQRGIPGIGNFQSRFTRFDTWRSSTELEVFGPLAGAGYRLSAYHLVQQEEYRDLEDEVGAGTQHDRNGTRGLGLRAEANALAPVLGLVTAFAGWRRETFDPENLLAPASLLLDSRRLGYSAGAEAEAPLLGERLQLSGGAQLEVLDDTFFDQGIIATAGPSRDHVERLWGHRVGLRLQLAEGWTLQGHRGRYQRAPNFYELFGDRGAVAGNTSLKSEDGVNRDAGLLYRSSGARPTGVELVEIAAYDNRTDDLIRFIQNSQRVSRPQNIGRARTRGLETRAQARLWQRVTLAGNYVYQRPENLSPYSYERGNDLPNAPRHRAHLRLGATAARLGAHCEVSRESRHFLDRANLRLVPRRTIHNLGATAVLAAGLDLSFEVRNLSDNQVADLWGYPLPGRAFFASIRYDLTSRANDNHQRRSE